MICQNCQQRPATVHLTKVVNQERTELHLCEKCAQAAGDELGSWLEPNFSFQNIIAALLEAEHHPLQQPRGKDEPTCSNCGLTLSDFRRRGLLGCNECYRNFRPGLEQLLNQIQGRANHTGKLPKRTGGSIKVRREITDLKNQLQQAVSKEDYETAAQLRDLIRSREAKNGPQTDSPAQGVLPNE